MHTLGSNLTPYIRLLSWQTTLHALVKTTLTAGNSSGLPMPLCLCMHQSFYLNYSFFSFPTVEFFNHILIL